jgi:hypothetical protein
VIPTAAELKARNPEFTDVSDPRVEIFIEEASSMVDESWVERDFKPAILALASHNMSMEGEPHRSQGKVTNALTDGRPISSRKVGDVSTAFESSDTSTSEQDKGSTFTSGLSKTAYGKKYLSLLRLNQPTVHLL